MSGNTVWLYPLVICQLRNASINQTGTDYKENVDYNIPLKYKCIELTRDDNQCLAIYFSNTISSCWILEADKLKFNHSAKNKLWFVIIKDEMSEMGNIGAHKSKCKM